MVCGPVCGAYGSMYGVWVCVWYTGHVWCMGLYVEGVRCPHSSLPYSFEARSISEPIVYGFFFQAGLAASKLQTLTP